MNKQFCDKLAHYASREPKKFLQLDGFHQPIWNENFTKLITNDFSYTSRGTIELMNGANVRVLIPYSTDVKIAVRQLKHITKWLKNNPELIEYAKPDKESEDFDFEIPF
jgi:ABC-type uncharacterized transport system YnjBCD substrate-binding protein